MTEFKGEDLALLIQDAGYTNDTAVEEVAAAERAWTEAQSEFTRFGSSASAAAAMQRKSAHAAQMAEHASEFIRLRVASALLAAGLRQYQEVHQGPLLTRASAYFKDLTGERYDGLQLDQDAGKILAVKGRDLLAADALSDGTQSPLFLSLRLAAIEAQAEKGVLLPLIADDLFVSMDDQRTLYALRALHRLSATTQIIYFGHELEIAEAATKELGGEMNIVRLDSGE